MVKKYTSPTQVKSSPINVAIQDIIDEKLTFKSKDELQQEVERRIGTTTTEGNFRPTRYPLMRDISYGQKDMGAAYKEIYQIKDTPTNRARGDKVGSWVAPHVVKKPNGRWAVGYFDSYDEAVDAIDKKRENVLKEHQERGFKKKSLTIGKLVKRANKTGNYNLLKTALTGQRTTTGGKFQAKDAGWFDALRNDSEKLNKFAEINNMEVSEVQNALDKSQEAILEHREKYNKLSAEKKAADQIKLMKLLEKGPSTVEDLAKKLKMTPDVLKDTARVLARNLFDRAGQIGKKTKKGLPWIPYDELYVDKVLDNLHGTPKLKRVYDESIDYFLRQTFGKEFLADGKTKNPYRNATKYKRLTEKLYEFRQTRDKLKEKFPGVDFELDHPLSKNILKNFFDATPDQLIRVSPLHPNLNKGFKEVLGGLYEKALDTKNMQAKKAIDKIAFDLGIKIGAVSEDLQRYTYGVKPLDELDIKASMVDSLEAQNKLSQMFDVYRKENPKLFGEAGFTPKQITQQYKIPESVDIKAVQSFLDQLRTEVTTNPVICKWVTKKAAAGGLQSGGGLNCGDIFDQDPDKVTKMIADEMPARGGPWSRAKTFAKNIFTKLPKGGKIGALVAGAGAVGLGTYAMMGDAEADDTRITDQTMTYNSTTGTFDNTLTGDPEDQEGILNWIAENPVKSGFTTLPAFMGLGYGLSAAGMKAAGKTGAALRGVGRHLMGWQAVIPAMMIPEKMHQWKTGMEAGEMITDPVNAIWALGIRSKGEMAAVKAYYDTLPADARFSLKGLKSAKGWKDLPKAFRGALMSPAAKGTDLAFQKRLKPAVKKLTESIIGSPFAKETAKKGLGALAKRVGIGLGAAALLPATVAAGLVSAPLTLGLGALSFGYAQYKDYRDGKAIVDSMRAKGQISEEDADNYMSLIKQGSLPFGLGNRLFGDDEMTIRGQALNPEQQRGLLAGMEGQIDLFQQGRKDVRALDRADDFDFFSEGGRVGMKTGGMDRRGFLKWLAGLGAAVIGGASGLFKSGGKQVIKEVAKQAPKQFVGVPGMPAWFPRAVQKIKTHGKLIEMADKDYVNGDIYEMILPVKVPKFDMVAGQQKQSGFETVQKKVLLEDNPINGEIEISWKVDDFDGEMTRQINFKPGESGFQKFGVDPEHPGAWEYERVKVSDAEFTYGNPDQSTPMRDDFEFKDIFTDGDEVVKSLEGLTGNKKMVAQDGSIIETTDAPDVDEAFKKKIFKDVEGEGALLPDPEGHMTSDGWQGEKGSEVVGGDVPEWVPKDTWQKKAGGGTVETGDIARRQSLVPPLSGPDPQGIMGLYSTPKQVRVG